jgi:hypothetical protein
VISGRNLAKTQKTPAPKVAPEADFIPRSPRSLSRAVSPPTGSLLHDDGRKVSKRASAMLARSSAREERIVFCVETLTARSANASREPGGRICLHVNGENVAGHGRSPRWYTRC